MLDIYSQNEFTMERENVYTFHILSDQCSVYFFLLFTVVNVHGIIK